MGNPTCKGGHKCHKKHEDPPTNTQHPIRAYNPSWNELYEGEMSDILETCANCNGYHMRVVRRHNDRDLDLGALVIYIDGACRNNGTPNARASIGVCFGPDCHANYGKLVPNHVPNTNQAAEIYAAICALENVIEMVMTQGGLGGLCKVLLITDSKYLVDGISDWIWRWKRNGWKTSTGLDVANRRLFEQLDEIVDSFEEKGIDVWFWHVRRSLNREADRLANEALD